MHLGDARGRERDGIDVRDGNARGRIEIFVEDFEHLGERDGRDLVLQTSQRAGVARPEEVRARGEDLAELDVGRSEALEQVREDLAAQRLALPVADASGTQASPRVAHHRPEGGGEDREEAEGEADHRREVR